jgi:hypothetical protein
MIQCIHRQFFSQWWSGSIALRDTLHGCREPRMGTGASMGKEAVLTDSRRAGEKGDFFSILA